MHARLVVIRLLFLLVVFPATRGLATTFVMPSDDEMVAKSQRIVVGSVQSVYVRERDSSVETVYDFRVERTLKGPDAAGGSSIEIVSPGGSLENRGVIVHGAAHFAVGEKVLLFLTRHASEWTPVDLTLGKFRFVTSSKGDRLLTRDLEDVGVWERDGTQHREKVRREEGFLRFIEERVAGRRVNTEEQQDYLVDASSVILPPAPDSGPLVRVRSNDTYTPASYTGRVTCPVPFCDPPIGPFPTRWNVFPNPVQYFKKDNQNIGGAQDGGVSTIQNALAAWTNDCGSNANLVYGGTTATQATDFDGINVVEFNDPQGKISGSFGGSGTVAIAFSSFGGTHSALSQTWWTYTSADIVFQDGYTAANASFATAMSHEVGHTIGWRHSNATPASGNDQSVTCSAATEDCTPSNTAIMFWQAGTFNFTLQPWDINAVRAVYPDSCVTVTPPTGVVATGSLNGGNTVVSWTNSGTATSYNVYRSTDNVNFTKISTDGAVTSSPFTDTTAASNVAYTYKVRGVASGTESTDSNKDFAVRMSYTDATIGAGTTNVQAAHFNELTTAANALRAMAGLAAISFTQGTPAGSTLIRGTHVTELRAGINLARTTMGFAAGTYTTDSDITAGTTTIKKAHVDDMRAALQ